MPYMPPGPKLTDFIPAPADHHDWSDDAFWRKWAPEMSLQLEILKERERRTYEILYGADRELATWLEVERE